ncbi:MAG: hypothetical protein RSG77_21740 [Hafnia sp.]
MPSRTFPFLCAQRSIDDACDTLRCLFVKHQAPERVADTLDLAQAHFHKALSILSNYAARPLVPSAEHRLLIKPTSAVEAQHAAEMLTRLLGGLLTAESPPVSLTAQAVQSIRQFLGQGFSAVIQAEVAVRESLCETDTC